MARLPPDVYRAICRLLAGGYDWRTLAVVARTCSTLQSIAEPTLYETFNGAGYVARTMRFFQTLATCPRVAGYVHEISVYHAVSMLVPANYLDVIARGMAAVKGPLRHFIFAPSIYNHEAEPFPSFSIVLRACLAKVTWLYILSYWDTNLVDFLERQGDALQRLTIGPYPRNCARPNDAPPRLSREALQRLSMYEGPAEHASQLFPGRPITHCLMRPNINKERGRGYVAAYSSAQRLNTALSLLEPVVQSLHVANIDVFEDLTPDVMRHACKFPNLRYLGRLTLPTGAKRMEFYESLVSMRALEYIELSLYYYAKPPISETVLLYFAHELRTYCPSVHTIIFSNWSYERSSSVKLCAVDNDEESTRGWAMGMVDTVDGRLWLDV
ncbi:hypothetical protein AURDEDRAFT_179124 [Auricularia subglabra TFB-10046 SS5]|nr:hypothetical protein AURDEDRAFT_179124 [Auricularia subglabra TFB-10046 SS5]